MSRVPLRVVHESEFPFINSDVLAVGHREFPVFWMQEFGIALADSLDHIREFVNCDR